MKKKIFAITLITAAVLAGCGEAPEAPAQPAPEPAAEASAPAETPAPAEPEKPAEEPAPADTEDFDPNTVFVEEEHKMTTVIEGCDTFTQIVDGLADGKGYTNTTLGDTDVLLVATDLYEYEPGRDASLDSEIFCYKDGVPAYLGYVACGGTAYPLQVKDGFLYAGGNHYMRKYTVKDDALVIAEEAYVNYGADGSETYYYRTPDSAFADTNSEEAEKKLEELFGDMEQTEVLFFDRVGGPAAGALPAYEYPGPEAFFYEVYRYIVDEFAQNYPEAQVSIPCPVLVALDDSDKKDIKLYGNFWIFNYDLKGDVLENTSGGAYPGVMHIKQDDTGSYEITGTEIVADGSDYTESAKKIFGKYYDRFEKTNADEKLREELRAQIIANYAADKGLNITSYQDYGWDPVPLPEQNIDDFQNMIE